MQLELGLKISKTVDDFTSSTDLLIAKDRSGPVFMSRETESMFILTAHLKGYKREFVKIEINEDGTRIAISGEKPVQEMVMVGLRMHKKETEMKGFRKVFKIPDGVILDKIKAKFNEEESVLTISMPKAAKGIRRGGVEEVKEEQVVEKNLPISSDEKKEERKAESSSSSSTMENQDHVESTRGVHDDHASQEKGNEIPPPDQKDQVIEEAKDEKIEERGTTDHNEGKGDEKEEEGEKSREEVYRGEREREREREKSLGDEATATPPERRSSIICAPIIAGSAFLVSIIVLVIHLIRNKNPPPRR